MNVSVRDWQASDLPALHDINERAVPGVGTLTRPAFDTLVREASAATLVAEADGMIAGFVLCMLDGLDYQSLNYRWLSERFEQFAYIDRIAVAAEMRGRSIGEALYQAAFTRFAGKRDTMLAEVNLAPPNPGSLRFHKRHGFEEVGERWEADRQKGVVYLKRPL